MTIELVTFDLDDTLWDVAPTIHSAEAELREWLTSHAPLLGPVPVEHLWAIRGRLVEADPSLRHRISELRRRVLLVALEEAGYAGEQARQLALEAFEVFIAARHQVEFFPEVEATLGTLAERYTLGVITNGNADIRRMSVAGHFKFAVCAEDLGIGKPDPAPFNEALKLGGFTAGTAVHIGDHPSDDIAGAQRAGLRAIWFNPAGKTWEGEGRPDGEIASLAQLPEVLSRW